MRTARQGETLVVEAPAKLNLYLEVMGRRLDGYHDLETVMLAVSLTDTLRFRQLVSGEIRFRQHLAIGATSAAGAPTQSEDNLVVRAARKLAAVTGTRNGAEIELFKRIPWQAGMGGGSSDAAATLLALNELWQLGLSRRELHDIAATLGSDLNFFIEQAPLAVCRGRGESIEPRVLRRRLEIVVAQPEGGLKTADVFQRWKRANGERGDSSPQKLAAWLDGESGHDSRSAVYNALQSAAEEMHSGIARLRREMTELGLQNVIMTGSGSACFGFCNSRRQAVALSRRLGSRAGFRAWAVNSTA